MKKYVFIFMLMFLAACQASQFSISELEVVPKKVQERIDEYAKLQILNTKGNVFYIVYSSTANVEADLELNGTTLIVKLDEQEEQNTERKHVFKVTKDSTKVEYLEAYINGEFVPFDVSTGV